MIYYDDDVIYNNGIHDMRSSVVCAARHTTERPSHAQPLCCWLSFHNINVAACSSICIISLWRHIECCHIAIFTVHATPDFWEIKSCLRYFQSSEIHSKSCHSRWTKADFKISNKWSISWILSVVTAQVADSINIYRTQVFVRILQNWKLTEPFCWGDSL